MIQIFNLLKDYFDSTLDNWILNVFINGGTPIQLSKTNYEIKQFIGLLNSQELDGDDQVSFTLRINKESNEGVCHIYFYKAFCNWLKSRSPIEFLNAINQIIKDHFRVNFKLYDDLKEIKVYSKRVCINSHGPSKSDSFKNISDYCHFTNANTYPYLSEDFQITINNNDNSELGEKLEILENLFSLTSILNISNLNEEKLKYKLNGFKSHEGEVEIKQLNSDYSIYSKISSWIYSDQGNISDKLGVGQKHYINLLKK